MTEPPRSNLVPSRLVSRSILVDQVSDTYFCLDDRNTTKLPLSKEESSTIMSRLSTEQRRRVWFIIYLENDRQNVLLPTLPRRSFPCLIQEPPDVEVVPAKRRKRKERSRYFLFSCSPPRATVNIRKELRACFPEKEPPDSKHCSQGRRDGKQKRGRRRGHKSSLTVLIFSNSSFLLFFFKLTCPKQCTEHKIFRLGLLILFGVPKVAI